MQPPSGPLTWRIVRINQAPSFDQATTTFRQNHVVTFMIGDHGPFTLILPDEQFTSERTKQLLDAKTADLNRLLGLG